MTNQNFSQRNKSFRKLFLKSNITFSNNPINRLIGVQPENDKKILLKKLFEKLTSLVRFEKRGTRMLIEKISRNMFIIARENKSITNAFSFLSNNAILILLRDIFFFTVCIR